MLSYILKRILIFIPTFVLISLLTFVISQNTPGDPVEDMLKSRGGDGMLAGRQAKEKAYIQKKKELGLHLPVFYFSVSNFAVPDTLYKINNDDHRYTLKRLINKYGNWTQISAYYLSLIRLESAIYSVKKDSLNATVLIELKDQITKLFRVWDSEEVLEHIGKINSATDGNEIFYTVKEECSSLTVSYNLVKKKSSIWKKFIPSIHWYGFANQYHRWLLGDSRSRRGFLRGDFGKSYKTNRPVSKEIWDAVLVTLLLSSLAILFTYLIAIPLGIISAVKKGSLFDQGITTILFMFYSLPAFWVGTLLIIFLASPDWLQWFPTHGLGDIPEGTGFWKTLSIRANHLALPLFCLIYPTFAFLSRQARGGILNVLSQDYIRTAYAKGLPANKIVWKHAFKNALLPVITMFANVFPYAIAGSFVVEVVFTIPGMGKLTLDALHDRNFPVVYTIVMLSAAMTMIGYLVADILYALADPRISYSNKTQKK